MVQENNYHIRSINSEKQNGKERLNLRVIGLSGMKAEEDEGGTLEFTFVFIVGIWVVGCCY